MRAIDQARPHIQILVARILATHYAESVRANTDQLSLFSSDEGLLNLGSRALVEEVLSIASNVESGGYTTSEFLAAVGLRSMQLLHSQHCDESTTSGPCIRERKSVGDLLVSLAPILCDSEIDGPVFDDALLKLIGSTRGEGARRRLLADHLFTLSRPRHNIRQLRPVSAGRPILQFDTAISDIPDEEYKRLKLLTRELEADFSAQFEVECPNELVNPSLQIPADEFLTRSAICRAAVVVVFTEHGRIGTGRTLEIATQVGAPLLELAYSSTDSSIRATSAWRFDGAFSMPALTYSTPAEAHEIVREFLLQQDLAIYCRAAKIAAWQDEPSPIAEAVQAASKVWPSNSVIPHAQALWRVQPIHWQQTPDNVQKLIIEIVKSLPVGPQPLKATPAPVENRARAKSRRTLNAYARSKNLPAERERALWQRYASPKNLEISQREETLAYGFEDWELLDRQLQSRD